MNALIKKEFDETFKWASFAMLFMCGCLAFIIYTATKHHSAPRHLISSDEFILITTAFCPAIALFLGIYQAASDYHNNLWPFLTHRPLPITQIFLAKTIVGLPLYLAAVTIPFILAATWLAMPGNIPTPFYWVETLPGFADILAGTGYYFTGLVLGLRSAKWYASKILPLGLPVIGSFAAYLPWFSLAVPCILAIVALTAFMAYGCFKTAGTYDRQPAISKISLALAIVIGISFVGFFVIGIIHEIKPRSENPITQIYQLDQDGHIITYQQQNHPAISDFKDLDDPDNPKYTNPPVNVNELAPIRMHLTSVGVSWYAPKKFYHLPYRTNWYPLSGYGRAHPKIDNQTVYPYYSHIDRLISIYDSHTKQLLYYVGPDGFSQGPAKPEKRFPEKILKQPSLSILAYENAIYRLNLTDKKLETFFTPDPGDRILGITTRYKSEPFYKNSYQLISTEKTLRIYSSPLPKVDMFDSNPKLQTILPAPYDTQKHDWILIARMPNGNYMVQFEPSKAFYGYKKYVIPRTIKEFTTDGQIVRTFDLPRHKRISPLPKFEYIVIGLFAPAGTTIPLFIADHWGRANTQTSLYIMTFTLMAFSALLCTITAITFAKRYAFTKSATLAWSIFTLLVGPAALFTFFTIRHWPTRPKCPACNKPRVVTRDQCEHCSAPFTTPEPDGTEIIIA